MKNYILFFRILICLFSIKTVQAQMETIQIDSNCVIYKYPEQKIEKFNSNELRFWAPELKHSYPKLLENTDINIRQLRISNVSFKNLPIELKAFPSIAFIGLLNCDSNMSKLFAELRMFPKLESIRIEESKYVKFTNALGKNNSLKNITIFRCDSVYISKEFLESIQLTNLELYIENVPKVVFESGASLDSINDFSWVGSLKRKSSNDIEHIINSIQYVQKFQILGIKSNTFPNNLKKCEYLYLGLMGLDSFNISKEFEFRVLNLGGNILRTIPLNLYDQTGILCLDFSMNQIREFRFDKLNANTFAQIPDSLLNSYWNEKQAYHNSELNLDWNLIDSVQTFFDTCITKDYEISLSYNNRKPKPEFAGFEPKEFEDYDSKKFTFTLPKGLFNLQFRGQLNLIGYNLSEEEKDKIRKHFKYAEVIFEEKKRR